MEKPTLNEILTPWLEERGWTTDYFSLSYSDSSGPRGPMGLHGVAYDTMFSGYSSADTIWYKRGGHHLIINKSIVGVCNGAIFEAASPKFLEQLKLAMENCPF